MNFSFWKVVIYMYSSIDTMWVLIATVLVFFMQAGFCMVETGFTRAKNAGNIIMKNLMDFALGTLVFWIIGYGLIYSGDGLFFGTIDLFISDLSGYDMSIPPAAFIIFQAVFCATAATIVSGAMAERTKFSAYCIYSVILSAVVYPISAHWIWGGGFLQRLAFHDFAGATAVHLVGGVAALCGAKILGPRIGKFSKDGVPKAIPGHSLTLGALGVFILWFSWFGFNGGSTFGIEGSDNALLVSNIFVTTNISAATAAFAVMVITWVKYKKPDISMTLNGVLAGLVAITAGCDVVSPFGAFIIGLIAAFVVVFGIEFVENKLKVDDPVGAVGVHGMCGATGTILVGLLSTSSGLLYGYGFHQLLVQVIGVLVVTIWVALTMTVVFLTVKNTVGLRVTKEEELTGLDMLEHGLSSSYADFMPVTYGADFKHSTESINNEKKPIPAVINTHPEAKMTKVVVVTNKSKFTNLKLALDNIGITGMTVTDVHGYGIQLEKNQLYRGKAVETVLLPKVKIELVVCKIPTKVVVDTIKTSLYTGNVGDGKIFVYDIENVIKVRTGEEGYDALQDEGVESGLYT